MPVPDPFDEPVLLPLPLPLVVVFVPERVDLVPEPEPEPEPETVVPVAVLDVFVDLEPLFEVVLVPERELLFVIEVPFEVTVLLV